MYRHAIVSLVLLSVSQVLCAADEALARQLLQGMYDASRQLNYDGVFFYQGGEQIEAMRVVHQFDVGVETERLIALSGPAREVIRDGNNITYLFADNEAALVDTSHPPDIVGIGLSAPLSKFFASYNFSIEGSDRVAGRTTRIVNVVPQTGDRYAYRLWIDEASGLRLKSIVLGPDNRELEHLQFTQITILPEIPAELLRPEISGDGFTWRTTSDANAPGNNNAESLSPALQVSWLPPGFEHKETRVQSMPGSRMPVSHMVYSDGLAMVSVFIEELLAGDIPVRGYSSRGAVNAFSRVIETHQVTVVGELPLPTVRMIANAVGKPNQ
jgi:sigma-E factor negative regulatory protein RseB